MFGTSQVLSKSFFLYSKLSKVLICGAGERRYLGCDSEYCRHNRCEGNVLCNGKSQQDVTCSCSRLTMEIWFIPLLYRDCDLMDENISVMNNFSELYWEGVVSLAYEAQESLCQLLFSR